MRNFIANCIEYLWSARDFAGNRVNELGNASERGIVPKFSVLEVVPARHNDRDGTFLFFSRMMIFLLTG